MNPNLFAIIAPPNGLSGFNEKGKFTSPSNAAFDAQLRRENPQMGLRDIEALESLAFDQHMSLDHRFQLPANNQLLVFRKNKVL